MNEPSTIKFSISTGDDSGPRSNVRRLVTLDRIIEWINNHDGLDTYTKNGLIDIAKKYPTAALPTFRRNFSVMLQRVRSKRSKERNGEVYDENEEPREQETNHTSLDEAFKNAFKNHFEDGPELQIERLPLFGEGENTESTSEAKEDFEQQEDFESRMSDEEE